MSSAGIEFNNAFVGISPSQVYAKVDEVFCGHTKRCRFEEGTRETILAMLQEGDIPNPWLLGSVAERMEVYCPDRFDLKF
jgi:hypothetical protein